MKKQNFAKIAALIMASTLLFGGCVGGGQGQKEDTENLLEIYVLEQGYGSDWARNVSAAFKEQSWVKEKYPDLEISLTFNDQVGFAGGQLELGEKYNTFDILFAPATNKYWGTKEVLDITKSVYSEKVPGEDVTFSEKLNDSLEASLTYTDTETGEDFFYSVPYFNGIYGFIYNEDALLKYGEVPRTTDEFIALAHKIQQANASKSAEDETKQYVFIQSKDAPYWHKEGTVLEGWFGQYAGLDGYDDFFNGVVNGQRSIEIFKEKGRLYALEVMEELLDYDNGFVHPQSFAQNFMVAQTSFLQGSAVFHYNGDYFIDEMKEVSDRLVSNGFTVPTIKMMKNPILSKIRLHDDCKATIADDAELSALVKAIDAGSTALKGEGYDVDKKAFDKVKEARYTVTTVGPAAGVIPAYSKAKDAAVDFMRFMATDIALVEYAKGTNGSTIDFFFDMQTANPDAYDSLAPLHKERIAYMNDIENPVHILKKGSTYPLGSLGGLKLIADETIYYTFSANGSTTTALDIYNETIELWNDAKWSSALMSAGLSQ